MRNKLLLLLLGIALATLGSFAQEELSNQDLLNALEHATPVVKETEDALSLEFAKKEWTVKKGDEIQIYLPAIGRADYMFIQKKKAINTKLISQVADAVGTGALAVGLGTNNLGVLVDAMEVARKADAVGYGVDALDKIEELNISKKAKTIAGKKAKVLNWTIVDDNYVVIVKIGKQKYEVNYTGAILTNEIKILTLYNKRE